MSFSTERLLETLRCPGCQGRLSLSGNAPDDGLECGNCHEQFAVSNSIPRLLLSPMREALAGETDLHELDEREVKTARSFGYEWTRFPEMYAEWEQSFLDYMYPPGPEFF